MQCNKIQTRRPRPGSTLRRTTYASPLRCVCSPGPLALSFSPALCMFARPAGSVVRRRPAVPPPSPSLSPHRPERTLVSPLR